MNRPIKFHAIDVIFFIGLVSTWFGGYLIGREAGEDKYKTRLSNEVAAHANDLKRLNQCQSELATFQAIVRQMCEGGR